MRLNGASTLPVMDEDDQSIVALAKSFLASGQAFDMASAMQMAREYAGKARAAASAQADAAVAAGDAQADARQAQRSMAQGVVPMEGETAADTQFRNRPLEQQEDTLDFQQDTADNVTRGLRDGTVRQPGSRAWNEELANNYATDYGIDESGDEEIVRFLAGRLSREPRPEEVAQEKKWRAWVNETPGSERQARYNKAGYDAQYAANARQFNEAERKKYGGPVGVSTIDPATGEWTEPTSEGDLTDEQQAARATRAQLEKNAAARRAPQRMDRLIVRSGLSDAEAQKVMDEGVAKGMTAEEAIRRYGDRQRARDLEFRTKRRLDAAYLAGGSHMITGQGQGVMNRLVDLPPEQRVRALLYSGPGGALAAQVDAQGLQNMMRMMNAEALAGADPFNRQLLAQRAADQRRKEDPDLAGRQDAASGDHMSPHALAHFDRLATDFDSGGLNTMSWEDEARLARHLMTTFKMDRPTAEAIANRAANKRRWWFLQGKPAGPGEVPPPGPAAGEMPAVSM